MYKTSVPTSQRTACVCLKDQLTLIREINDIYCENHTKQIGLNTLYDRARKSLVLQQVVYIVTLGI